MARKLIHQLALVLLGATLLTPTLAASDFVDGVREDTAALCESPNRLLGSPGHEASKRFLTERISAISGVRLVRQSFPLIIPRTERATLTVASGPQQGQHKVFPVWPDVARLKTTPAAGLSGNAVYIANGRYEDLPAAALRGQIAALEMSAYHNGNWLRAFEYGAKAVLLLGSEDDSAYQPLRNSYYKPRYYVPEGELATALRKGMKSEITLHCDASWGDATGENLIALLPGTDTTLEPIVLACSYDAMSVISDLAPGADNALDAAYLLRLLEYLAVHPPKRGVAVAFVDGFGFNLAGMRELMGALAITPEDMTRKVNSETIELLIEEYEGLAKQVEELGADPLAALPKLSDKAKYQELQRYVKDVLSPERIAVNEQVFKLRLDEVKLKGEAAEEATRKKVKLIERQAELDAILSGVIRRGEIPEGQEEECREVWRKIRERITGQLAVARQRLTLFEEYDAVRAEILDAMGITEPSAVPFPFVLGIDISDAGSTVGPSFFCGELCMPYKDAGVRKFMTWLRKLVEDTSDPYGAVAPERLKALGIRVSGLKGQVERLLEVSSFTEEELAGTGREEILNSRLETIQQGAPEAIRARVDEAIASLREASDEELDRETELTARLQAHLVQEKLPTVSTKALAGMLQTFRQQEELGTAGQRTAYLRALLRALPEMDEQQAELLVSETFNQASMTSTIDPSAVQMQKLALLTSACMSFQTSGLTWTTLEGVRSRLDTPQDTAERLDWSRIKPQIALTSLLVEMLLNDPEFATEPHLTQAGSFPSWRMPEGQVVSETVSETIARTPSSDMLVTAFNRNAVPTVAVRGYDFIRSGPDGRFRFRPAPGYVWWQARNRQLRAYTLDERGRIVQGIAKIKSMLTSTAQGEFAFRKRPPLPPLRGEVFNCVELNGPLFRDPRYQTPLIGGRVIDVNRGGTPTRYFWNSTHHYPTPMFGLLEPESRYQVILALGGGKNRMVLLNTPDDLNDGDMSIRQALQNGFHPEEPLPELPELISARDFFRIDEWRLRHLEKAGVILKAIRAIHEDTRTLLDEADASFAANEGEAHKRASASALANEIRVYHAVQAQADDVTRGAIFLLLLLVPFSIAMERLLFASPGIARQITLSIVIFFVMFGILASFHPAFRITSMPAVILIAFLVLLLSSSVINMLLNKFQADMEELRRGTQAEASGAQTKRGGVIGSAIWLGIANMRKRMVRTILTGMTIVLVTFALLCFASSSTYQDKRTTKLDGIVPTHEGILLQNPANLELDPETEEAVATLLGDDAKVSGRYWASPPDKKPNWRIHVRNAETNQLVKLKAGLALRPDEHHFSGIEEVLPEWSRFADGRGVYLSELTAERLGIRPGDNIVVAGKELTLIATFDSRDLEKQATKLDGQSLLPVDFSLQSTDATLGDMANVEAAMSSGAMAQPDPSLIYVSGDEVIVFPVDVCRKLGASLRSIAIRPTDGDVQPLAERLMRLIAYPVYYGIGDEVRSIVSTPLIPKAPRNIFIPILIAALIIFNTMLNSIAERRREIHIYSSLGLAPNHIGWLFLAEALTYGVMGSVFGYIIGQGLATILTGFDLMGGITLNYSGSNVIMTMGLVLLIVALSAVVPAIMAARVASPSGSLDWKVPQPRDGAIHGLLPFTVSKLAAPGLAAFLYEYIDAHRDGAIGNFTSADIAVESGEGDTVVKLKATIWPAPYDLGVRQDMTIDFTASEADICNMNIRLDHRAGQERSWWRLNRVFLSGMRAQLLGWRNIDPQRMLQYIRQSERYEAQSTTRTD